MGLDILIFMIPVSLCVAKITDHFKEFDSHVAKLLLHYWWVSLEKLLWHASILLSIL